MARKKLNPETGTEEDVPDETEDQGDAGADKGAQDAQVPASEQSPLNALRRRPFPKVGPGNEPNAAIGPEDAIASADEEMVTMIFPKEVTLTGDDHRRVKFPIGRVNVPAHLADHWYLKAHGAKRA